MPTISQDDGTWGCVIDRGDNDNDNMNDNENGNVAVKTTLTSTSTATHDEPSECHEEHDCRGATSHSVDTAQILWSGRHLDDVALQNPARGMISARVTGWRVDSGLMVGHVPRFPIGTPAGFTRRLARRMSGVRIRSMLT